MRIVRYWQEGLWQTIYNQQPLPQALVETAWQCKRAEVDAGVLQSTFPVDTQTAVWVAPLVFYKSEPQPEYWVPLWLPALAEKNHLALRKDNSLPWVPASQFDTCQNGPFQGERGAVDDWLRYECLDENNEFVWETWPECVKACIEALDIFSEQPWQQVLIERGFEVIPQSMIWTEAELLGHTLSANELSPLLKQFGEIEEVEKLTKDDDVLLPISALLCGSAKKDLSPSTYQTVRMLLSFQDEALITLRTPVGSDKAGCLSTFIASKIVGQTIKAQRFPKIGLLTNDTQTIRELLQTLTPANEAISLEQIKQSYVDYQNGLKLFVRAESVAETEKELLALQQQDEALEKILMSHFKKQDELKPKSRLARFFNKFSRDKQKAAEVLMLSEKIRKCKTKRTNIHRKIVNVVEVINENRQFEKEWQAWLQQALPGIAGDIQSVQLAYSNKLLSSTLAYWQQKIKNCLFINPHADESLDLLLVDEAQKRLPQEIASHLAKVKQALFLGDIQADESMPAISQLAEERALAKHQLDDEETIEQMHYKGMLLGTGNALTVAMANTKVSMASLDAGFYHPQIAGFLKEAALSSPEAFIVDEGLHLLNITGSAEKRGHQFINELEAHAIVNWLINGPFANKQHLIQIFTPFSLQKDFIKQQLQLAGVTCTVYDFAHLPNQVGDYVVFSPVHTNACRRPFIFDRGSHHFYRMMARARRAFWIIGDKRIFDPKMHSPSGQLAKCLFAKVHPCEKRMEESA
jgi:hypothetical protein